MRVVRTGLNGEPLSYGRAALKTLRAGDELNNENKNEIIYCARRAPGILAPVFPALYAQPRNAFCVLSGG